MPSGADFRQFVVDRPGASGPSALVWRPDLCARVDLKPDAQKLNETSLVSFLREQQLETRVERQPVEPNKPELVFVFVSGAGAPGVVPLRVAILPSADEAGRALAEALAERGDGAWGVHRANLAVLGPNGHTEDDVAFAAKTHLACWGTFTFAETGEPYVVPGGYAEP
jgi:hypothetical protein